MLLKEARIRNFRSVADITIPFSLRCRILVGKNESGKSNILRALALLAQNVKPSRADVRIPLPSEDTVAEANVLFVFVPEPEEVKKLTEELQKKTLSKDPIAVLLDSPSGPLSIPQLCESMNEVIYYADMMKQQSYWTTWTWPSGVTVRGGWCKPTAAGKRGADRLSQSSFVEPSAAASLPPEMLEPLSAEDVSSVFRQEKVKMAQARHPDTIYWSYDEKNLMPAKIDTSSFATDPNHCVPLRNMFQLAGIPNIAAAIKAAQASSYHAYRNLLNRVAEKTTKHFREVWREYKRVRFILSPNANVIDAGVVEDFNHFDFSQRSDGFKRSVSFLLAISSQVRTDQIRNNLLLIDEPDTSLHPSASRFLKDEILRISKSNYVVYATHSIHMIDRELVSRHLVVTKVEERTKVDEATESSVSDEEVLYNALGASVFEGIREKNILFEGWCDKKLFRVAVTKPPKKHSKLAKFFVSYGTCQIGRAHV
jgi:energy-coupling factor transporter ATP-binding protein EcfA2